MAIISTTCERSSRDGQATYTGVDPDEELRECPGCCCKVAIDPRVGEILHVEAEYPTTGPDVSEGERGIETPLGERLLHALKHRFTR